MSSTTATLPAHQVARLHLRPGDVVVVRQGRLWLTCQGDARDHVLQAGTCFVATRPEGVVIEALGGLPCRYEVERPAVPTQLPSLRAIRSIPAWAQAASFSPPGAPEMPTDPTSSLPA